jgi:hypothetical protein
MREKLINWLGEICFKLNKISLSQYFKGVSIMDRYLIRTFKSKNVERK